MTERQRPMSSRRAMPASRQPWLWTLLAAALLSLACSGPRAELRRRGIPIQQDELVARARVGDREVVDLLLQAKVPVNGRDAQGLTAMWVACDSGRLEVARLLLERGADPELEPDPPGAAPLALASMQGHRDIVHLLLAAGADVEKQDPSLGMSPLMLAALNGHEQVVAKLLEAGAAVAVRDATGWTALHHAARAGHTAVASRLLAAGANPQLEDADGWTALALSKAAGHWQTVLTLEEHLAEEERQRRTSRLASGPLAIPPGWSVDDRITPRSAFWPEHAAFIAGQDPPGSKRILLRSPRGEEAQIFLILGRLSSWWEYYRETVREIESDPTLEQQQVDHLKSKDGVVLELRRYRLRQGFDRSRMTERVMAFGEARGEWVVVVDAGGSPGVFGVDRIEHVLRESRLLDALGAEKAQA